MTTTTTPTDPVAAMPDEVLTTEEAARFLKISVKTLQVMVRAGQMHPRRFGAKGKVWRFVRAELLAPVKTDASVTNAAPVPVAESGKRLQRIDGVLRYR